MQLPEWNGLTNEERSELCRIGDFCCACSGGQMALDIYLAINKMLRERELREDRATMAN